jgi:hypothetical protein
MYLPPFGFLWNQNRKGGERHRDFIDGLLSTGVRKRQPTVPSGFEQMKKPDKQQQKVAVCRTRKHRQLQGNCYGLGAPVNSTGIE